MTAGVYVLSCRLASGPLWLGIYPFLWWFLLVIFVLFLLHWRYELPCQDKLPEFHSTPILGCIRILWLVFHPLGLRLDKTLCGWNSVNPTPYPSGSKTKPNPTLGKSTPTPKQVHQHSQDEPTEESPPDTSTQTLVNKCLAESGIDSTDIQNVMSVSHAKRTISSHDSSRKIQTHKRYVFARVNQSNHHLIDRGANGGLAGADMRVIHTTPRKINIVGIDDHELTGLNVVTAAALLDTQKGPIIGVFP